MFVLLVCQRCGKKFFSYRRDTKYCSTRCRVAAKRARDKGISESELREIAASQDNPMPELPKMTANADKRLSSYKLDIPTGPPETNTYVSYGANAISQHIIDAKGLAAYFDVASERGPKDMRPACEYLAAAMWRTFKELGL